MCRPSVMCSCLTAVAWSPETLRAMPYAGLCRGAQLTDALRQGFQRVPAALWHPLCGGSLERNAVFVGSPGVLEGLAVVQGLQDSQLVDVLLDQGRKLAHDVATLAASHARPGAFVKGLQGWDIAVQSSERSADWQTCWDPEPKGVRYSLLLSPALRLVLWRACSQPVRHAGGPTQRSLTQAQLHAP